MDKEKEQKPQSANDKSDKKPAPQSGNLVWYMLGLGVLLLLMVTMFSNGGGQQLGFSDLMKLVEASGKGGPGYIDVIETQGGHPPKVRISDLENARSERG